MTKIKEIISAEDKLLQLYNLQKIHSKIDELSVLQGELPEEVQDLEDELAGLETRIGNFESEMEHLSAQVANHNGNIQKAEDLIAKYEKQQMNVKNNREFDSLNKEIEFQNLEIQLSEKRSKEFAIEVSNKNLILEETQSILNDRESVLKLKQTELASIVEETKKEEDQLVKIAAKARTIIDERLLAAYTRVRTNARNGLGVVAIQRDACGGCFNKIPPQRQLDIRQHKKVIVCEHCGRILVDPKIADEEAVVAE